MSERYKCGQQTLAPALGLRLLIIIIFLFSLFLLWANNITSQENELTFLGKTINSETLSN